MIGVDNEEPQVELERTEYVKVGTQHALLRRVVEAAEIDTVVDTRLVVDSATTTPAQGAREQRHRDDEHPRGLQRARLAGPQGRLQVLRALLRLRAGRPGLLRRDDGPPAPAAHPHRARRRRGRGLGGRVRREEPGGGGHRPALRERARPERPHVAHRALLAAGGADDPRLRPALPVRARGRRGSRARARGDGARPRASTTWRATACSPSARWRGCSASPTRRSCRPGARGSRRRRSGAWACGSRPRR